MLHRSLAALSLLALATTGLAAVPAGASTHPTGPRSERVGVAAPVGELTAVLQLAQTPAAAARLSALSRTRLHPAQARARRAGASTLAPGTAARDAAVRFATAHGLRVLGSDGWSVTVSGQPSRIAAVFGTRLTSSVVRGKRYSHTSTAPVVPAALRGSVAGVVGLDERPAAHPHAAFDGPGSQDGPSLRAAYGVPVTWRGSGVTVATLNLSGWDSSDLYAYASQTGTPTTSSTLTEVNVAPGNARTLDGFGGDFEVVLDSETLLATAPAASQRAYFGDNSAAGVIATLNAAATDAEAGRFQVFTTSWGACEAFYPPATLDAYGRAVQRMLAAGVTVYAASGDSGAYDCAYAYDSGTSHDNTTLAVDYPASDPGVVGTGGTSLPDASRLTEITWSSPRAADAVLDYQGDGSGGGFSSSKARPSYQQSLALPGLYRSVPDVSSDADPATGLAVVYTDPTTGRRGIGRAGGTSLASPTWAGFTAAALSAAGRPRVGFGNILPTMYANPTAFRDITQGDNHNYAAGPGYDQATGLGVPRWDALGPLLAGSPALTATPYTRSLTVPITVTPPAGTTFTGFLLGEGQGFADCSGVAANGSPTPPTSYTLASAQQGRHVLSLDAVDSNGTCHVTTATVVYDLVAPTVRGAVGLLNGLDTRLLASWTGTDAFSPMRYDVSFASSGGTQVFATTGTSLLSRSTAGLVQGATYRLTVRPRDAAGNVGASVQTYYTVPRDDRFLRLSSGWTRTARTYDFLGSNVQSATRGASATWTLSGREFRTSVLKSNTGGYLDVYVDGLRTRYDLYSPTLLARYQIVLKAFPTRGTHTVRMVVVGAHRSTSRGSTVFVDSVRAAY